MTTTAEPTRPFRSVRPTPEPTRAVYPDEEGYVERDGVRVFWERYGDGEPTLLLMPGSWPIAPVRVWRSQLPYYARHHRVVCFDPRGNGLSDRPSDPEAYDIGEFVGDALAVLDASGTDRAVAAGAARGAQPPLMLAADHPERVLGLVLQVPQPRNQRQMVEPMLKGKLDRYEGWDKFNPEYMREDFHGFLEWFAEEVHSERHHTRAKESTIEFGLGTDPETLATASCGRGIRKAELPELAARIECPVLIIAAELDLVNPPELARELADLLGARLEVNPGAGHGQAHGVVRAILWTREFVDSLVTP